VIPILSADPESAFPPIDEVLEHPPGLLAAGGDLSPQRLLNAYRQGIFPWYSEGQPILWWSPVPRCVIYPDQVHASKRLIRRYNTGHFRLSTDTAFVQVIEACAAPRTDGDGTWITSEMQEAYIRLHELGIAHSVEVRLGDELVGGIYGLGLGRVFFGESMFSSATDASKIALVALCRQLQQWKFSLVDCQIPNPHLVSMGAVEISRAEFQQHLQAASDRDHWQDNFQTAARW